MSDIEYSTVEYRCGEVDRYRLYVEVLRWSSTVEFYGVLVA